MAEDRAGLVRGKANPVKVYFQKAMSSGSRGLPVETTRLPAWLLGRSLLSQVDPLLGVDEEDTFAEGRPAASKSVVASQTAKTSPL
ncbi:hypothetical protein TNCV_1666961 [Trichonephila clavipes]|nr:hypothetical protein TNCV_1666961 [Trichonephila clavipes]